LFLRIPLLLLMALAAAPVFGVRDFPLFGGRFSAGPSDAEPSFAGHYSQLDWNAKGDESILVDRWYVSIGPLRWSFDAPTGTRERRH
jgi:hypothetical protein